MVKLLFKDLEVGDKIVYQINKKQWWGWSCGEIVTEDTILNIKHYKDEHKMRIDTRTNRTFYVSDCVNIDCGYCRNVVIDGFKYIKPLPDNNDADIKYWVGVDEYELTSFLKAHHPTK